MAAPSPQLINTQLLESLVSSDIAHTFLKIMFVLGGALYVIFAFVVIRQISLMRHTVITTFSRVIQLVGYLHFGCALAALLYFLLFL